MRMPEAPQLDYIFRMQPHVKYVIILSKNKDCLPVKYFNVETETEEERKKDYTVKFKDPTDPMARDCTSWQSIYTSRFPTASTSCREL
jgi:hypothetical protein